MGQTGGKNDVARDADLEQFEEGAGPLDAEIDAEIMEAGAAAGESVADASDSDSGQAGKLAELERQASENHDKYIRALAELENYKKRAIKERSELIKYQGERILADLIEVLDNLSLAIQYKESDPQKLAQGLEMVHKMFVDALGKWEIRAVSAVGKEFDPTRFEALSKVAVDDAAPGTVIQEIKAAYMYKDKLLRAGSVIVATEPDRAGLESTAKDVEEGSDEPQSEQKGEKS